MDLKKTALIISFLLVLFAAPAIASTIKGSVYAYDNLDQPITGTIIKINTNPLQQLIAKDGNYSFTVPLGQYTITAKHYTRGMTDYEATEDVNLASEGTYNFDLILLPPLEDTNIIADTANQIPNPEEIQIQELQNNQDILLIGITAAIIAALLITYALARRKMPIETEEKPKAKQKKSVKILDTNAQEVITALKEKGNRATQKELLAKVHYGEAYLSLVIAELENEGIVKKIKRGRGNIIVLANGSGAKKANTKK